VLYNAAIAAAPVRQDPVLMVGGQQMVNFVHSPQGRAGHFGGCCGNCKWRDYGARYVIVREDSDEDSSSDDSSDSGEGGPGPQQIEDAPDRA
jgi:hypothetical protein